MFSHHLLGFAKMIAESLTCDSAWRVIRRSLEFTINFVTRFNNGDICPKGPKS